MNSLLSAEPNTTSSFVTDSDNSLPADDTNGSDTTTQEGRGGKDRDTNVTTTDTTTTTKVDP